VADNAPKKQPKPLAVKAQSSPQTAAEAAMINCLNEGLSIQQTSRITGLHFNSIRKYAHRHGVELGNKDSRFIGYTHLEEMSRSVALEYLEHLGGRLATKESRESMTAKDLADIFSKVSKVSLESNAQLLVMDGGTRAAEVPQLAGGPKAKQYRDEMRKALGIKTIDVTEQVTVGEAKKKQEDEDDGDRNSSGSGCDGGSAGADVNEGLEAGRFPGTGGGGTAWDGRDYAEDAAENQGGVPVAGTAGAAGVPDAGAGGAVDRTVDGGAGSAAAGALARAGGPAAVSVAEAEAAGGTDAAVVQEAVPECANCGGDPAGGEGTAAGVGEAGDGCEDGGGCADAVPAVGDGGRSVVLGRAVPGEQNSACEVDEVWGAGLGSGEVG